MYLFIYFAFKISIFVLEIWNLNRLDLYIFCLLLYIFYYNILEGSFFFLFTFRVLVSILNRIEMR